MGNREDLLRGAKETLLECGYAGATAREITRRAGTSLAAIGYHFGSTETLLHEAIADGFQEWRSRLAEVVARADGTPGTALASVGKEVDRLFAEDRRFFTVFLEALALADRTDEVRGQAAGSYEDDREGIGRLCAAIRGGAAANDRLVASVLLAVVDGLFIQHLLDPSAAPPPSEALALLAPLILTSIDLH